MGFHDRGARIKRVVPHSLKDQRPAKGALAQAAIRPTAAKRRFVPHSRPSAPQITALRPQRPLRVGRTEAIEHLVDVRLGPTADVQSAEPNGSFVRKAVIGAPAAKVRREPKVNRS